MRTRKQRWMKGVPDFCTSKIKGISTNISSNLWSKNPMSISTNSSCNILGIL